jgi:hypothetical protein
LAESETQHLDTQSDPTDSVDQFVAAQSPHASPFSSVPPMNEKVMSEQIKNSPDNKAKGVDSINTKLLKIARPNILPSLTYIYNFSISSGIFPYQWKIGKITPVQNQGPNMMLKLSPNICTIFTF